MRLTKHTDYALRVLMFLAMKPEQNHTIEALAERFSVSKNHLMKVAHQLTIHGYIVSQRGRGGGLKLGQHENAIRIGSVIADMEPSMNLVDCAAGSGCPFMASCTLKRALRNASQTFVHEMNKYTLADLVGNESQMLKLIPVSA